MSSYYTRGKNFTRKRLLPLGLLCVALSSGCGGGGGSQSTFTGFPSGSGTNTIVLKNVTLSESGSPNPFAININPPTLTDQALATPSTLLPVPNTMFSTGPVDPTNLFPVNVTISIDYSASTLPSYPQPIDQTQTQTIDPSTISLYYADGSGWTIVTPAPGTTVQNDTHKRVFTIQVNQFQAQSGQATAVYQLLAPIPPSLPPL